MITIYYYERSFLIVFHNVWSTGPGKVADPIFEFAQKVSNLHLLSRKAPTFRVERMSVFNDLMN